jgi:nitrate reductase (NAD(P)H)
VGRRGRVDRSLLEKEVGSRKGGEEMVLVCGPEAMETSVKEMLGSMGWEEQDMVFF